MSDILGYNIHIAFPLNGALAQLRGLKSAAFKKVRSRRLSGIFLLIIFASMHRNLRARARACTANLLAHANPNSPQAYFSDHQCFNGGPVAPFQVLRVFPE